MAEEKIRFQMRISPDTDRRIKEAMPLANCQSKNEFVEKALLFFCGYLSCDDNTEYLAPLVVSSLQSTVKTVRNVLLAYSSSWLLRSRS